MIFLLDANMPRSALRALTEVGHEAQHVRDIGLGDATDARIDEVAQAQGWVLITRDLDFADTRSYPAEGSPGRLVLRCNDTSTAADIVALLQRFLRMQDMVVRLPGHLAILEPHRVRFRPALSSDES